MPFFRSLVETVMGIVSRSRQVLRGDGEDGAAVGGDDDGVLDAHAAVLGQVHARLDGDDVAGGQGSQSTCDATRGASWISRPTPWPVPWRKASAQPASSMTARQASSTALPSTPAAHRGHAGPLALGDDVEHPAAAVGGAARRRITVRVMSE